MSRSSPGRPTSAKRGTCRVDDDEARVAAAAVAAAGEHDARARMREVGDQAAVVGEDLRADGDVQLGVVAVRAVLAGAAAVRRRASP